MSTSIFSNLKRTYIAARVGLKRATAEVAQHHELFATADARKLQPASAPVAVAVAEMSDAALAQALRERRRV